MDLDDSETLELDKMQMYKITEEFPEHCKKAIEIANNSLKRLRPIKFKKIAVCGMGGSSIGGNLLKDWLKDLDVKVFRDYDLPKYVDKEYLLFAVSYSGNTEETLSMVKEAIKRKINTIAISSNGRLEKMCKGSTMTFIKIPEGMPPRSALPYLFLPMVVILNEQMSMGREKEIVEALDVLGVLKDILKPENETMKNISKKIAMELKDKIPVIYGFGFYNSVAYRAKTQFNENSKVSAFSENFPELTHNAILGWVSDKEIAEKFAVIIIRDKDNENEKIKKRIEFTESVIKKSGADVIEVEGFGKSALAKMLSIIYIMDFASIYLGFLYEKDPSDTELISLLKKYVGE